MNKPYESDGWAIAKILAPWEPSQCAACDEVWKEAQKKLLEWIFGFCTDPAHYRDGVPKYPRIRGNCSECMQSLLKDFGLKDA